MQLHVRKGEDMAEAQWYVVHTYSGYENKVKAKDRPSQTADLGRAEPRHPEAGKQQGLQQKQSPELEA